MAKKQFIRHLEYYGFPDQNTYTSELGGVDLSDIREKNKEQDEEIKELTDEKASKKALDDLSDTVDSIIDTQSEINHAFSDAISGMSDDIDELKGISSEFAEQISAMTDSIDDIIETIEEFSADTNFKIADTNEKLDEHARYAESEFAHADNVYTKAQIDDMFSSGSTSGFVTYDWVEQQGFLTEESGDTLYVRQDDFDVYSGEVESAITGLEDAIYVLGEKIDDLSANTESAITELRGATHNLDDEFTELEVKVLQNKVDIQVISGNVEDLREDVDEISGKVDTNTADIAQAKQDILRRVTLQQFNDTVDRIDNDIEALDQSKANKTDLTILSGKVNTLDTKLNNEINERVAADIAQNANIANLNVRVTSAETLVRSFDGRINDISGAVDTERAERIQADKEIIGQTTDTPYDNTIYGAKKYADFVVDHLLQSANTYTDEAIRAEDLKIDELREELATSSTTFATTGYVEQRLVEVLSGDSILDDLQREITERINGDEALSGRIDDLEDTYSGLSADVSHIINKVGAITEWDGENPEEYEPWASAHTGSNGILDILHREFHEFEQTYGTIKSIEIRDGNLIITYETVDGEKQTIVPISEILVLDDYYKKEETDALLDEKLDVSAYTDISDQVSANTENIGVVSGNVVNLDTALAALIEKLGYKDNDTLVTNGEHEVAFGEYNISHESEDPSGQTVFSVGIGTDDTNRSNAVEIMKNGDLYLWVEGEFMNVNKLLGQIAHEIYDNDSAHNSHFFDGD